MSWGSEPPNPSRPFDLTGAVAVVIGGSSGIGLAAGRMLARLGATLVLASRSKDRLAAAAKLLASEDGSVDCHICDIREPEQVAQLARRVAEDHGPASVLVNSGGVLVPNRAGEDVLSEDWAEAFAVNATGVLLTCQAFGRQMLQARFGRIINISSQASVVSLPNQAAYTASKGALDALTRSLAIDWAPHGITVNGIRPTFMVTPMTERMLSDQGLVDAIQHRIPVGRLATPDDVAGTVAYLAARESSMITGQILMVDGGWTAGQPELTIRSATTT